ncbi:MAG TPA: ABC transporter substrate-binding protein [Acidimicrobiales bacterium]
MSPRLPRHRRSRFLAVLAAALALAAVAASCSSSSGSTGAGGKKLDRVTVILDWTPNTNHSGLYIAQVEGWYRKAGLDVKIEQPGDNSPLQLLAAGKADIAVSVEEDVTPAIAQGLPVQSVAAIIQHNTSSLVSLKSAGIQKPGQLAGKTYGGYGGQLEKALIRRFASCGGGDPDKVKFVNVGEADYRVGLTRKLYDVVWIFDGWDGIRLRQIDKLPVNTIEFADHRSCIPDWYTPLLATSTRMEKQRPDVLKRFMAATAHGYRTAMTDPAEAVSALMKSDPALDRNLVTKSAHYLASRYASSPATWGQQDPKVWAKFTAFLRQNHILTKPIDLAHAFTNQYLPPAPTGG